MFVMEDFKHCIIKQNKAEVEAVKCSQFSETCGWLFFLFFCKSIVDRVPLF